MSKKKEIMAFPGYRHDGSHEEGLSKREYFAAMAMQGFSSNPDWCKEGLFIIWDDYIKRLSEGSVELADKMLEELSKSE